tara:strand:- start:7 stop:183 length:177 start_codon:yes stop_codon:yes gene_type:complete
MSTTTIHKVKEIKVKAIRDLTETHGFVRDLIVTDENGNEFELTMFANRTNELTIKSEM